mmetsp:Transcript_21203/g.44666  ORF Transcript_21203/g.44666 Transcript_21203/m.44666 type:complete len:411 (+) Transcript_21203:292-1524(+)
MIASKRRQGTLFCSRATGILSGNAKLDTKLVLVAGVILAAVVGFAVFRPTLPTRSVMSKPLVTRGLGELLFSSKTSYESSWVIETCELPSCDLVLQSRMYSKRCKTEEAKWPLLVTGTPRSATQYIAKELSAYGLEIANDWVPRPSADGTSSWIFAVEDEESFGPEKADGYKFRQVLHQLRQPLASLSSICAPPELDRHEQIAFLRRHISLNSSYVKDNNKALLGLEFWVEWHEFLDKLNLPTYQIETVEIHDIFVMAGLDHRYNKTKSTKEVAKTWNNREHRAQFTWQQLLTVDPDLAYRAWTMAHRYGYTYDVEFADLTCLESTPTCDPDGGTLEANARCPPGSKPQLQIADFGTTTEPVEIENGWISRGCIEVEIAGMQFGIPGEEFLRSRDLLETCTPRDDKIICA